MQRVAVKLFWAPSGHSVARGLTTFLPRHPEECARGGIIHFWVFSPLLDQEPIQEGHSRTLEPHAWKGFENSVRPWGPARARRNLLQALLQDFGGKGMRRRYFARTRILHAKKFRAVRPCSEIASRVAPQSLDIRLFSVTLCQT